MQIKRGALPMPQQKSVKKPAKKVVKSTRPAASVSKAKQTKFSTNASKAASTRKRGVRIGSGTKKQPNALFSSFFEGSRKWVAMGVFVVLFGGVGAYLVNSSRALLDMNDYGCKSTVVIKEGSRGACVWKLQNTLKKAWGQTITVDGKFGPATKTQVKKFQINHCKNKGHCPPATKSFPKGDDGIVGSWTWKHVGETSKYRTITSKTSTITSSTSNSKLNLANAANWDRIAKCESGGRWSINTGNGYYGGLQFNLATWKSVKGTDFAAYPHQASREEQITVANRLKASRGLQPWGCKSKW